LHLLFFGDESVVHAHGLFPQGNRILQSIQGDFGEILDGLDGV
jgi:hypothetical protein